VSRSQTADEWWRSAVIYQIYPRSFADSNGDGVGDLEGIVGRLDHLAGSPDSLGVDAIWLSPFYPSPMADLGYDASNYVDVDPVFGTLQTFDELLQECHRRSIKVLIDLVPNHTSDQHAWFLESRSSRTNPKRDWYVWREPRPDGSAPTNWLSVFQTGTDPEPAWTFDPGTGQFYLHSFLPAQPDLNWLYPEVRRAFEGVMRFWLDRGVDGFRVDAIHRVGHDPLFADDPMTSDVRYPEDLPLAHEVVRGFRKTVDSYPERMMVGEAYLLDLAKMASYYGTGRDEFHLVFNFSFLRQRWSARGFASAVRRFEDALPGGAWPDYTLCNHDHPRTVTRYGRGGLGLERARLAAMMLLTLRGTPFLYYGEEIGMADARIPRTTWIDPIGRDGCRTPMRWNDSANAGFTTGRPWLPIGDDVASINVEKQRGEPGSMLDLYRRLIALRRAEPALSLGTLSVARSPKDVFAFQRRAGDDSFQIALNFSSSHEASIRLSDRGSIVESTHDPQVQGEPVSALTLRPLEGVIVRLSGSRAAGAAG
jgi:alpha-glucosidase